MKYLPQENLLLESPPLKIIKKYQGKGKGEVTEVAMKTYRGSGSIAPHILDLGTRRR
jgi:hypothetical protein